MPADILDRFLITLAVRLHAFAVCEIQEGWRLVFDPMDAITIHYVLSGTGTVRIGTGLSAAYGPQNIILVPARTAQSLGVAGSGAPEARADERCTLLDDGLVKFTAGDGSRDTLVVCGTISAAYGGALGLFEYLTEPLVEDVSASNMIRHAFETMLAEVAEPGVGTQAMAEALMKQCLILVLRQHLARKDNISPLFAALQDTRIARAVTRVLEAPAAPHSVESLAAVAGMSRSAFAERFSQVFDHSPIDFVLRVRLRLGAHLLTTTDLPVNIIASSVGYTSRSYFSRAFRGAYGIDPKTFRKVGGAEEEEPSPVEQRPITRGVSDVDPE
jgi:AraC-like DNA-binding protein